MAGEIQVVALIEYKLGINISPSIPLQFLLLAWLIDNDIHVLGLQASIAACHAGTHLALLHSQSLRGFELRRQFRQTQNRLLSIFRVVHEDEEDLLSGFDNHFVDLILTRTFQIW